MRTDNFFIRCAKALPDNFFITGNFGLRTIIFLSNAIRVIREDNFFIQYVQAVCEDNFFINLSAEFNLIIFLSSKVALIKILYNESGFP